MKYDPFLLFSLMVQSVGYLRLTEVYVHLRSDNRLLYVVQKNIACATVPLKYALFVERDLLRMGFCASDLVHLRNPCHAIPVIPQSKMWRPPPSFFQFMCHIAIRLPSALSSVRPHFRSLPLPLFSLSGLGDPKEPLFPLLFLASFRPLSDSGAEGTPEKRIWRRGFLLSTNTTGESFPT